jgi:hypothetical protein
MLGPKMHWRALGIVVVAVMAVTVIAAGGARGRDAVPEPVKAAGQGPVVVELFTSQGCSSCPPADRLLSRLKHDPRLAGAVIPLAFHVDYWNRLGWSDPFSSALWSQRQTAYAHTFRSNRVYTPQLVVNGRTECVGSEEAEVMRRIREALAAGPAGVVSLAAPSAAGAGDARLTVTARLLRPVPGAGVDVWVALTESGLSTAVGAGENATATLHNDQVVRRLVKAFTLPPTLAAGGAAGDGRSGEVTLPIDGKWNRAALDVVAFLQDPQSLAIYGAASRPLAAR